MRRTLLLALFLAALAGAACGGDSVSTTSPSPSGSPAATATPAPSQPITATPELVTRLRPSVVQILSEAATLDIFGQVVPSQGAGTGFVIDQEGHIATNNHVVTLASDRPAQKITVTLSDGRQMRATIVGRDTPTDLAVLEIDAGDLTPVRLGSSSALQVGQDVVAIGNALDLPGGPTVTKDVVSALGRVIQENGITIPDAIQTDAAINPDNSGGPLVNMQGEVVGITTAIIAQAEPGVQAQGIGLAISIDSAKPIINELITKGRVDRGLLGIRIGQISPSLAQICNITIEEGVPIVEITPEGPADTAGFQTCDVIVKLADVDIKTSGNLFAALTTHRAGEKVQVQYYRDGKLETAEVTLG